MLPPQESSVNRYILGVGSCRRQYLPFAAAWVPLSRPLGGCQGRPLGRSSKTLDGPPGGVIPSLAAAALRRGPLLLAPPAGGAISYSPPQRAGGHPPRQRSTGGAGRRPAPGSQKPPGSGPAAPGQAGAGGEGPPATRHAGTRTELNKILVLLLCVATEQNTYFVQFGSMHQGARGPGRQRRAAGQRPPVSTAAGFRSF